LLVQKQKKQLNNRVNNNRIMERKGSINV
jgi:hypothetical protein